MSNYDKILSNPPFWKELIKWGLNQNIERKHKIILRFAQDDGEWEYSV